MSRIWKFVHSAFFLCCEFTFPLFHAHRHRRLNMFLQMYCNQWLQTSEHSTHDKLTEELLDKQDYLVSVRQAELRKMTVADQKRLGESSRPDPLTQLLHMFKREASAREW